MWGAVRNGLFHSGFTEGPTLLSNKFPEALAIEGRYLHINPEKFVAAVEQDFNLYVRALRTDPHGPLAATFVKLWDQRWSDT